MKMKKSHTVDSLIKGPLKTQQTSHEWQLIRPFKRNIGKETEKKRYYTIWPMFFICHWTFCYHFHYCNDSLQHFCWWSWYQSIFFSLIGVFLLLSISWTEKILLQRIGCVYSHGHFSTSEMKYLKSVVALFIKLNQVGGFQ